jgi:radical SAM superfamily enzyme YgiQ (UPF0313 family)
MPPGRQVVPHAPGWRHRSHDFGRLAPLGLMYLAAALRKAGFPEIELVDAASRGLTLEQISGMVRRFRPQLVGLTSFSLGFAETDFIARAVKAVDPQTHVCVGGPQTLVFPALTLEHQAIDSIVKGEGEFALCNLARALERGDSGSEAAPDVIWKDDRRSPSEWRVEQVPDLDEIPHPARDLADGTRYYSAMGIRPRTLTVITSRGCPYRCSFCDVPFKTVRNRSIDDVVEEIRSNTRGSDTEVFFYDDTLNLSSERFATLCEAVAPLRLPWSFRGRPANLNLETLSNARRAGCFQVHLGVETLNDDHLRFLKKSTTCAEIQATVTAARRLGIRVIADIMIGLPFEKSERDVLNSIRKVIALNPHYAQINVLQLVPGTELFNAGVDKGLVSWEAWHEFMRHPERPFQASTWNEYLPQHRLGILWRKAYRLFYMRPRKVFDLLWNLRSVWDFRQKLWNGRRLWSA